MSFNLNVCERVFPKAQFMVIMGRVHLNEDSLVLVQSNLNVSKTSSWAQEKREAKVCEVKKGQ